MCDTNISTRAGVQAGRQFNGIGALVTLAASVPNLTTLRVSNAALKSETLPARIKILQWGDNDTTKGKFTVGQKTVAKLAASQRALGFERVALDYNHCSIPGTADNDALLKNGKPPMIFGYGRPNALAGDGVWLEDMEWTPLGLECGKQFEDLSPAVHDENGEVTFIHSVALTPNGSTHGLTFFSAMEGRAKPVKGRERLQAAFEQENAARDGRGLARLSAAGSGAQVSTSANPNDNPQGITAPMTLAPDAMAQAVYAEMEGDIIGDDVRARLRRMVSRRVNEGWIVDQKRKPGNRTAADYARFQQSIEDGTDAALRAYAKLKLNPSTAVQGRCSIEG